MRAPLFLSPLLANIAHAVPRAYHSGCAVETTTTTVPSSTETFTIRPYTLVYETETTPRDDGTYTIYSTITSTSTLETITTTTTECTRSGTITAVPISTVYTTAGAASSTGYKKRSPLQFNARDHAACTITETETSTGGVAFYDYTVPSTYTSTYSYYTTWTEVTVYETKYNGKSYVIETATATTEAVCGPTVNATSPATTSTVTMDARCSPAAMTSAYKGYGLEYKSDTPASGGHYDTTTNDASECCQLCASSWNCAASAFDIRTGKCTLEFPVDPEAGYLNCGEGMLAYYDAGPNSPMSPGEGLYVQALCGNMEFGSAAPDDGT